MGIFVIFVMVVGLALNAVLGFGWVGSVVIFAIAMALTWGSYWNSDKIALRMSRAVPADEITYARLHNLVEGLCIASGLPKPKVYVVEDEAPNAFATGRDPKHAAIAVTTGLLHKMNRVELEGVVAHELSHIKNYDILVSTIAVTLVGFVALASDLGTRMLWSGGRNRNDNNNPLGAVVGVLVLVTAPLGAKLLQMAVGRKRESLADLSAVEMTRYPPGLISALEKLRDDTTVVRSHSRATSHLWIEQPLPTKDAEGPFAKFNRLFDTHPPLDYRIATLREL